MIYGWGPHSPSTVLSTSDMGIVGTDWDVQPKALNQ